MNAHSHPQPHAPGGPSRQANVYGAPQAVFASGGSFPGGGGGAPIVREPTTRERIARIRTLAGRALRYWKVGLVLLVIGSGVALALAVTTKLVYRSECIVQFHSGMRMTERADEESPADRAARILPRLHEELTTHARLEKVIREFGLYPQIVESKGMQDAIDQMRDKVGFRGKDSETFVISFENEDKELAQKVAQRLADTMVEQYTEQNLSGAKKMEDFLSGEEKQAEADLETANKNFAVFLEAHPEFAAEMKRNGGATTGVGMGMSGSAAGGAGSNAASSLINAAPILPAIPGDPVGSALARQRARLEAELKALASGQAAAPATTTPDQDMRLTRAKAARDDAQKNFDAADAAMRDKRAQGLSDEHPDMLAAIAAQRRAKADLAGADAQLTGVQQEIKATLSIPTPSPESQAKLQRELDQVNAQIAEHGAKKGDPTAVTTPPTTAPSGSNAATVAATTAPVEPVSGIVSLETDWQRLLRALQESKSTHDDIQEKLERAHLEAARTKAATGDSMSVLDPAYLPMKPSKGGRTKTAMAGGVASLLLALLYMSGRVAMDDSIYDAADIESLGLVPVLGVVTKLPRAPVPLAVPTAATAAPYASGPPAPNDAAAEMNNSANEQAATASDVAAKGA